jgi:hypothetical protein
MHAPPKTVALGGGEHLVFLRVVEVFQFEPRLLLAKWGRGQFTFAVSLKRTEIMFQPGHQRDMPDRAGRRQRLQQVAHQGAVDPDVFGFGVLAQPRADEDVAGTQALQG